MEDRPGPLKVSAERKSGAGDPEDTKQNKKQKHNPAFFLALDPGSGHFLRPKT